MTDYYPYGKSLANALTAENATVRGMYFSLGTQSVRELDNPSFQAEKGKADAIMIDGSCESKKWIHFMWRSPDNGCCKLL